MLSEKNVSNGILPPRQQHRVNQDKEKNVRQKNFIIAK